MGDPLGERHLVHQSRGVDQHEHVAQVLRRCGSSLHEEIRVR